MWNQLRARPVDLAILLVAVGILAGHQWLHRDFIIDDAAICFAFARNIATGEGIVPWPGGERIESFSNPTWMALLTLLHGLGLDGFTSAKPLAVVCGALTIPVTWRLARRAMPDDTGLFALIAPVVLALSAQLAIWSASGLENALWSLLLAIAIERTVADAAAGRFLGSALAWLLIVWTRPEGALYAAVGGVFFLWFSARRGPVTQVFAAWLAVVGLPSIALEVLRIWYFAWPLPNTYYAKLVVRELHPFDWNARGWFQVRDFAGRLWHGYWLPIYLLGLLGRTRVARNVILGTVVLLLLPAPSSIASLPIWPQLPEFPNTWLFLRLLVLSAGLVALPAFADRTRPGFEVVALSWSCAVVTLLFSVYASGDWMGGYRWMSLLVVPMSVLFAAGAREVVLLAEQHVAPLLNDAPRAGEGGLSVVGWLTAAMLVAMWIPPNLSQSKDHLRFNVDETAPRLIARADFTDSIRKKTFFEGKVYNLEMDQGGTIWRRPDYDQIDMASLVDVSMGRHTYRQRAFIEEYVFGENPPTFGHVHGWWADFTRFKSYPQWNDYFLLPPNQELPPPRPPHGNGMWANRRLVLAHAWPGVKRPVAFGPVVLHGLTVPADVWPVGGDGYLELGLSSPPRAPGADLRLVVFLVGGAGQVAASWEVPAGYGLLGMDEWRADEVFVGRFAIPVPRSVLPGTYTAGVVILGPKGAVWKPSSTEAAPRVVIPTREEAVFAAGEVRFLDPIEVVDPERVEARAAEVRDEAIALAAAGKCLQAESTWVTAKRYRPRAWETHEADLRLVKRPIADCWARRAESEADRAAEWLAAAHRWDHRSSELARVGAPQGDRLWQEGLEARASEDAETAYRKFTELLDFQPWRSWARRYAEEARDQRLGLQRLDQLGVAHDLPPAGED